MTGKVKLSFHCRACGNDGYYYVEVGDVFLGGHIFIRGATMAEALSKLPQNPKIDKCWECLGLSLVGLEPCFEMTLLSTYKTDNFLPDRS